MRLGLSQVTFVKLISKSGECFDSIIVYRNFGNKCPFLPGSYFQIMDKMHCENPSALLHHKKIL